MPDYRKFTKNIKPWKFEVAMQSSDCAIYSMAVDESNDNIFGVGKNGLITVRHNGDWTNYQINKNIDLYGIALAGDAVCMVGSIKSGVNVGLFASTVTIADMVSGNMAAIKNQVVGNGMFYQVAWNEGSGSFVAIHHKGGVYVRKRNEFPWKPIVPERQIQNPRSIVSGNGNTVYVGCVNGTVYAVDVVTGKKSDFDCKDARGLAFTKSGALLTSGKSIAKCSAIGGGREVMASCIFNEEDTGEKKHSEANIFAITEVGDNDVYACFGSDGLAYTLYLSSNRAYRESFYPSKGTMLGAVYVKGERRVYVCGSGIDQKLNACIVSKHLDDFCLGNYWEVGSEIPVPPPVPVPVPNPPPVPVEPPVPVPGENPLTELDKRVLNFGYDVMRIISDGHSLHEELRKLATQEGPLIGIVNLE